MGQSGHSHKGGRHWLPWLVVSAAVVVAGVVGGLIASDRTGGSSSAISAVGCNATSVANKVLPSIVTISVQGSAGESTGSGEVIRSDGYILTNNHVISEAAQGGTISVQFADGTTVSAVITGRDPLSDLAVIKVAGKSSLPVIPFGSSSSVVVGEPVVVLGAPLGLSSTVTTGIVSALNRTVQVPSDNGQTAVLASAIQTDAAINPGNSGGSMVDCSGDLIGVPSAGAVAPSTGPGGSSTGSIGLGFAIPVDVAKSVSDQIIATGTVTHAFFGVSVVTLPQAAAKQFGVDGGLYVASVVPGGPAATAGLRQGDVITELNGQPVTSSDQLAALTITEKPGDTVTVTYLRNGQSTTTKVVLGTQPSS
jgi:putative serine protease PepD